MKIARNNILVLILLLINATILLADETIVFVRHGEKPKDGLGQLTCQGLNRALKLPCVLENKYGKPDFIFTSNPSELKTDHGIEYRYVRPIATILPTAIKFELPINDQFGFKDINDVANELMDVKYKNSTIYVAWEHHLLVEIVKRVTSSSQNIYVPNWNDNDFDSIYVVIINHTNNSKLFSIDKQNLNNLSKECPN